VTKTFTRAIAALALICGLGASVLAPAAPAGATAADRAFVYALWEDFVGSQPPSSVVTSYETQLGNGTMSRAAVVNDILDSAAFRDEYIWRVFDLYTGRFPYDAEYNVALWAVAAYGDYLDVELQAIDTDTYSEDVPANADFVTKVFNDVLWRAPDPSGMTYWTTQLNSGTTRRAMAQTLIRSNESARKRTEGSVVSPCASTSLTTFADIRSGSYCILLKRPADASGSTFWTTRLSTGGYQLPSLWKAHAGSTEYYNKALVRFPSV